LPTLYKCFKPKLNDIVLLFKKTTIRNYSIKRSVLFILTFILITLYLVYAVFGVGVVTSYILLKVFFFKFLKIAQSDYTLKVLKYKWLKSDLKGWHFFFLENILFDVVTKYGFFYSYSFFRFFQKNFPKNYTAKSVFRFWLIWIIQIIILFLLNFIILVLRTNLDFNDVVDTVLFYKSKSNFAYLKRILIDVIIKINFYLDPQIRVRRILIVHQKIKLYKFKFDLPSLQ